MLWLMCEWPQVEGGSRSGRGWTRWDRISGSGSKALVGAQRCCRKGERGGGGDDGV